SVQLSGGDPTLRSAEDLEALCREIRRLGMRSCLMTNGIKATRALLSRLARAGLDDVAFHVDLTQERAGYPTEVSLNTVRRDYLARAEGLGLRVLFNTTVHAGNMAELPALARFFREEAARVTLASFQLQADTGRGVLREREAAVTQTGVMAALSEGFGTALDFDSAAVGHERCNRYASVLVAGARAVPATGAPALFAEVFAALEAAERPGEAHLPLARTALRAALRRPGLALRLAAHGLGRLRRLGPGLRASRGRVHRIAVLVHNFMDASALERDRCEACVFKVATEEGPLSMCVHNARRDHHLFTPARLETAEGPRWWSAATGRVSAEPAPEMPPALPPDMPPAAAELKRLKGRARAAALAARADAPR
ncbi:MAG: radical SAM protein, partial [Pseudomonadota bacterium]